LILNYENLSNKNFAPLRLCERKFEVNLFTAVCIILLTFFSISSCDVQMTGDYKSFDRKLRGTWVSNETGLYAGSLKIDSYTITIDCYGEDWTSLVGDDSRRPFKDFPKRVPLPGYSEGCLFLFSMEIPPLMEFPMYTQK